MAQSQKKLYLIRQEEYQLAQIYLLHLIIQEVQTHALLPNLLQCPNYLDIIHR